MISILVRQCSYTEILFTVIIQTLAATPCLIIKCILKQVNNNRIWPETILLLQFQQHLDRIQSVCEVQIMNSGGIYLEKLACFT